MTRLLPAGAVLVLATVAAYAIVDRNDPTSAIARELRAGVDDPANNAAWAQLIRAELASVPRRQTFTAAMPCFWRGEARFGVVDGVVSTTAGYQDGHEVVRVEFDPTLTSADALRATNNAATTEHGEICKYNADLARASVAAAAFRPDDQPHWYIQQTTLRAIPMTPAQAARINAYLHARKPVDDLLSPAQQKLMQSLRNTRVADTDNYAGDNSLWKQLLGAGAGAR